MEAKKNTGIWIDSKQAVIVKITNGEESIKKINSNLVTRERIEGEGKQQTRMGKQYSTFEKKEEEKRKHILNDYFNHIVNEINGTDSIMIFGPAEAKVGLQKVISKNKDLASKLALVDTEDHLTDNQIAAKVRDFYNSKK